MKSLAPLYSITGKSEMNYVPSGNILGIQQIYNGEVDFASIFLNKN